MTDTEIKNKPPVAKIRIGNVHATVWKNGDFYSAQFERRYQDKDEKWQTSHSFGPADLLPLAKAADRAHDAILALLAKGQPDE